MDGVVQMLMNVRRTHASVMVESAPIHQEVIYVSALRACFQVWTAHHVQVCSSIYDLLIIAMF
jgi:hypothetical protein